MFALHSFYVNENRVKCSTLDFFTCTQYTNSEICYLNDIETKGPLSAGLEADFSVLHLTALPRSCSKKGAMVIVWEHIDFFGLFVSHCRKTLTMHL